MFKKMSLRRFLVLWGSMLLHLTFGMMYTYGNLIPYITSYLHVYGSNPNVTTSDLIWIQSMGVMSQGIFMNVGGLLTSYVDPRIAIPTGCIIVSSGVALSYFSLKHSAALITLTFGFMYGAGMGMAYMAPVTLSVACFPNNKALITGLIVGALGFAGCIFSPLQTEFINPNNTQPTDDGYFADPPLIHRVSNVFLLMGAILASIQVIGCVFIYFGNKRKNEDTTTDNGVQCSSSSTEKIAKSTAETCQSLTPRQMLCHRQFYVLWATYFFNIQLTCFISAMYKAYGETFIDDDKFLALVGAVAALFNASGRILWGFLMDKFNYKLCVLCVTAGCAILAATMPLTPHGGKIMFAFWVWGINLFFSGNFTLAPAIIAEKFGLKFAAINYGLLFTYTVIASPLNALIVQYLTSSIGLDGLFGLFGGCSGLSFLISLLLFKM